MACSYDSDTITDPVKMAAFAKLSFPDLQKIFDVTGEILNEFSHLYRDIYAVIEIIGQTDYENVIEFVSKAKCEQFRQYEAEFHEPAPFPRPKGRK